VLIFRRFFSISNWNQKRVKRREENKKKKNNNERVKEREIPGGGTFIVFDLSPPSQKRFAIQFERQLCAQEQQQH
jgi:hypothetical protein